MNQYVDIRPMTQQIRRFEQLGKKKQLTQQQRKDYNKLNNKLFQTSDPDIRRYAQLLSKKNLLDIQRDQLGELNKKFAKKQQKKQQLFASKYPKCYTLGKDNSGIFCPSTEVLQALRLIPQAA